MRLHKMFLMLSIMVSLFLFGNGISTLRYFSNLRQPPPLVETKEMKMPETRQSDSTGTVDEPYVPEHEESSISGGQPVNLLVLGLDEEEVRTDVILLFNYSPEKNKLNILSIPRDTRVYARGRYSKINALYSAGGENLLASEVRQITGLPVHYYITMNFEGFRKIVDELGGVNYRVPLRMDYDDPEQDLHIHLKKGMQLLDGAKAEQLVRYRKGNDPDEGYINGDIGRIEMQQDFIRALIDQKLNIRYISKIDDIFGILKEYMSTNIGVPEISHYIGGILRIRSEEVNTFSLPGDSIMRENIWYYIYNRKQTAIMLQDNFFYEKGS